MDSNTEGEDNSFQHYTPQHPLPEEIKKLARDDTVCKYCGVSYLIHNEIKALQDKLAVLEKELTHLRGQEKREALLNQENALLKDQRNDLQSSLEAERRLVASLKTEADSLSDQNKKAEDSLTSYKDKYMTTLRQFSALSQVVRQQKQGLTQIREATMAGRTAIEAQFEEVEEKITCIRDIAQKGSDELTSRIQCLDMEKLVLSQSNTTLTASLREAEQKLAQKEAELAFQKEALAKLEKNMEDSDALSGKIMQLERAGQDLQKELELAKTSTQSCKTELDQCKSQISVKNAEMKEKLDKINELEKTHEAALHKLNLELNSKEGELLSSLKHKKTLENRIMELERREAESKQSRDMSQNEAQDLKESLQRAKADREALKAERELMIEAHQNRIEELRESFKNKMVEMDNWPQKLQAAVAAERSKYQSEMKTLEDNLKHNFVLELQIEKDKYNELLKKFQAQERDKTNMRQSELAQIEQKFKQEAEDLRRQLAESKRREQEREEELKGEIASLKKIIKDLQDRLARLDTEDSGQVSQLRAELGQVQQELSDERSNTAAVQTRLKEAQDEAQFLQKIVQKECEERFELTEALSEARKQLLELKKPPGGYNSGKRGSIVSLGSAHSSTGSLKGETANPPHPPAPPGAAQQTQLPPPPSLSRLSNHQGTSNIVLSYSNNNNNTNKAGGSSVRSSAGSVNGHGNSSEAQLRESRKRIANMMGRIS